MSAARAAGRGTPLATLALVLAGWALARLVFILPFATAQAAPAAPALVPFAAASPGVDPSATLEPQVRSTGSRAFVAGPIADARMPNYRVASATWRQAALAAPVAPPRFVAEQNERPSLGLATNGLAPPAEFSQPPPAKSGSRWSLDAWLFLREGGAAGQPGGSRPALGGSQMGAIARYALARGEATPVAAYVRVSRALAASGESEAAGGLVVRPLQRVPVSLHAELRLTRQGGDAEPRPAAFMTAGAERPLAGTGFEARGYAQAGYVGGRHATAFVDAQLVVERPVLAAATGSARIGAGAWGGAQQGAARADVGPVASVELDIADAPVRLEASYRLRIAGEAQPGTGLAITLSTGF